MKKKGYKKVGEWRDHDVYRCEFCGEKLLGVDRIKRHVLKHQTTERLRKEKGEERANIKKLDRYGRIVNEENLTEE